MRFYVLLPATILFLEGASPAESSEGRRGRPGVIAHRGAGFDAPENTLPALERAIALGCAMAEVDLRYTADGEIVLMHDLTVDRTTDGAGKLSEFALARLGQLDAGSWFGEAFRGTRIPTLQEAIALCRGKTQLYLDLKEEDPAPVARRVQELQAHPWVVFRPYTYWSLKTIMAIDSRFRVLVDLGDWVQAPGMMQMLKREFPTASFSSDLKNWNPQMVAEARRLGIQTFVNVLGPDDTSENLERAVALGFDYIQTDYPERLQRIIGEKSRAAPKDGRR
jgi:glycerophosphoryl diester phosphodiesterase